MSHRAFRDSRLVRWDVWEIVPATAERRMLADRRSEPRPSLERRQQRGARYRVGSSMVSGWLCFESDGEKRRLAPIPDAWETLPETMLERLLDQALPARKGLRH